MKKGWNLLCRATLATIMSVGALAVGCAGNIDDDTGGIEVSQDQIDII